jgi:hypothetical protein
MTSGTHRAAPAQADWLAAREGAFPNFYKRIRFDETSILRL